MLSRVTSRDCIEHMNQVDRWLMQGYWCHRRQNYIYSDSIVIVELTLCFVDRIVFRPQGVLWHSVRVLAIRQFGWKHAVARNGEDSDAGSRRSITAERPGQQHEDGVWTKTDTASEPVWRSTIANYRLSISITIYWLLNIIDLNNYYF